MLAEREELIQAAAAALRSGPRELTPVRGVVLVGWPGSGSTAVARAIQDVVVSRGARAADWPSFPTPWSHVGGPLAGAGTTASGDGRDDLDVVVMDNVSRLDADAEARLYEWLGSEPRRRAILTLPQGLSLPRRTAEQWSTGALVRFDVAPLTHLGTETAIAAQLGGPITRGLNDALGRASGGLPLLLRELVVDGLESGAIVRSGGVWAWSDSGGLVGRRTRDLVRGRIDALTSTVRDAVELVACSGGAPVGLLLELVDADGLDECERRGLVVNVDGVLRARPPAIEQALVESMTAARRTLLRRRINDALTASTVEAWTSRATQQLAERAAIWALDIGTAPLPDAALAAARTAALGGDWAASARLAAAAIDTPLDEEARLVLATAQRFVAQPAAALVTLAPLLGRSDVTPERRRDAAILAAEIRALSLDDVGGGLAVIDAARGSTPDPALDTALDTARCVLEATVGRFGSTLTELERIAGDAATPSAALAAVWPPLIIGLTYAGRTTEAFDLGRHAAAALPSFTNAPPYAMAHVSAAAYLARLHGGWGFRDLPLVGDLALAGAMQLGLGLPLIWNGGVTTAMVEIDKAIASFGMRDSFGLVKLAAAAAAAAAVVAGDPQRGIELLDRTRSTPGRICRGMEPTIEEMLLWPEFCRGGAERVATVGGDVAAACRSDGLYGAELSIRHTMLRLGVPMTKVGVDELLLDRVDGPRGEAFARQFRGLAADDAAQLMAVAEQLAASVDPVIAAEAAAQAHQSAKRSGARTLARSSALLVRSLTENIDTSAFPLLRDWPAPERLTRREREVVTLAAQQLTNRDIALRLGMSRRTVEAHLHRAYGKLGVSDRSGLRKRLDGS